MSLQRHAAERVRSRIQRGSSSPVVVDTSAGTFVVKLRGAGQGVLALIAEIVVGELAQALGLPVPERVLIDLPAQVPSDDRNDELADLLARSEGENLGLRWLEQARDPRPEQLRAIDDAFAARVLWLDGLTMNPDRSPSNPNIVFWNGAPWLIDHGAALTFHHDWSHVTEQSPREAWDYSLHVFAERRGVLQRFDGDLIQSITPEVLSAALAMVPDAFLDAVGGSHPSRDRAAYETFLYKRLKSPRPFLTPA